MKENLTFKDFYKTPFKRSMNGLYVKSDNNIPTFIGGSENADIHLKNIVEILNGNKFVYKYDKNDVSIVDKAKIVIYQKEIIIIRGWGSLIGCNGFGLKPKEAAKVQDDFIQWVVDMITEKKEDGLACTIYGKPMV